MTDEELNAQTDRPPPTGANGWNHEEDAELMRAGRERDLVEIGTSATPIAVELPQVAIFNQGGRQSCAARALIGAAWVRAITQGVVKARPFSWRWLWRFGRTSLDNVGMSFSRALAVFEEYGCPAAEHWPDDDANSDAADDDDPPPAASRHAWDQRGAKFRFRPLSGSAEVRQAIVAGLPVVVGFLARYGGPHAVVIVGYDTSGPRESWTATIRHSWGEDMFDHGYERIPLDAVDGPDCIGLIACDWVPSPSEDFSEVA